MSQETASDTRGEVIEKLVAGMLAGLDAAAAGIEPQVNGAEMLSSVFTMAFRFVKYLQKSGTAQDQKHNMQQVRDVAMRFLMEAADPTTVS